MTIDHLTVKANGLDFHVATTGAGPLVVLAHGFPELWYCWRHQMTALAEAGYRVVAPDMRGYGGTDAPASVDQYSIFHLVGDLVALVGAMGAETAHLVGHDWGAGVSWQAAMMRPDIFRTLTCMSVPFQPRREGRPPIAAMRAIAEAKGLGEFYILRFQEEGAAEREFEADLDATFRIMAGSAGSGHAPEHGFRLYTEKGKPFLLGAPVPERLPRWLTEADLAVFVDAYRRNGFRGPLNWYRNIDRNWELTAPWQGATIPQSTLYITGAEDHVRDWAHAAEEGMRDWVPGLADLVVVPGAGHWVHQEAPEAVNRALISFLDSHRF